MNQELIDMAKAAGFERLGHTDNDWVCCPEDIEAFAKLVAKHTLSNIDPSKFMSYQEGIEAGRFAEREACIRVCMEANVQAMDFTGGTYVGGYFANAIKQRGETK